MSQPASASGPGPSAEDRGDIPVTVIGGYLGSGKTTLVNHLLTTGVERLAILVNDFGDVDIDASLIERDDGETIALANGCICCSLVDGLAAALATVTAMEPRPDRLVIEASGVADPGSVAAYGHGPGLALDAVIVLVDAETIRQRADDKYVGDTVRRQLASADIVVVNKVDLVAAGEVERLVDWLGRRIDRALVVQASRARVDPAVLFGVVDRDDRAGSAPDQRSGRDRGHRHADDVFQTWTWTGQRSLSRETIESLMADLPDGIVRAKGVVQVDGDDADDDGHDRTRPHVLQRVGGRWSLRPASDRAPAATIDGSRLVLIGRRNTIDDRWLHDRLTL